MDKSVQLPIIAAFTSIISIQTSAALSKTLFPLVGSDGVAALRIGLAAVILFVLLRPYHLKIGKTDAYNIMIYGLVLGAMNVLIYRAFSYIPVGIAVSIEVTGPLCLALFTSRSSLGLLWAISALAGIALLPSDLFGQQLNSKGLFFAFSAAACWAFYIMAGKRVAHLGSYSVAAGMIVTAVVMVPLGLLQAGSALFSTDILLWGLLIAVLSSVFPYLLDMYSLKYLPGSIFGILMSASPAMSALSGYIILGEQLGRSQWLGILLISLACLGCALTTLYKTK